MIYPPQISDIVANLSHAGPFQGNAAGSDANFSCGAFVRFHLSIDKENMSVEKAGFSSNGCGFMVAATEALATYISGKILSDLHGLDKAALHELLEKELGDVEHERKDCISAAINAFRTAFSDFRYRQIEEFRGERALICTCFGITEEAIEDAIKTGSLRSVDEVATITNAGNGCGSCRMLIQEILDSGE